MRWVSVRIELGVRLDSGYVWLWGCVGVKDCFFKLLLGLGFPLCQMLHLIGLRVAFRLGSCFKVVKFFVVIVFTLLSGMESVS